MKDLPNLGPKSEAMLKEAGITSVEQLRSLGSVKAFLQVKNRDSKATLNLLWALEGALTGRSWQEVASKNRLALLLELEDMQKAVAGKNSLRKV